jgi:hypothetical protein
MRLERVFVTLPLVLVRRLLYAVVRSFESGLSPEEVDTYCARIESQVDRDDLLIEPFVRFHGQETPFIIDIRDKPSGEFELVFITSPTVSQLVQNQISAECGGVTPRVIPAYR